MESGSIGTCRRRWRIEELKGSFFRFSLFWRGKGHSVVLLGIDGLVITRFFLQLPFLIKIVEVDYKQYLIKPFAATWLVPHYFLQNFLCERLAICLLEVDLREILSRRYTSLRVLLRPL